MGADEEFATIDVVLASGAETRGVDAFALALIKSERQMRKLVTYLVFQSSAFTSNDIAGLRTALGARKIFFGHLLTAWDELYPRPLRDLVGAEHARLRGRLAEATAFRNKLFHGQLTDRKLSREELIAYVADIRTWCQTLGHAASHEVGYDGLDRGHPSGSYRKAVAPGLPNRLLRTMNVVQDYVSFLRELETKSHAVEQVTP